MVTECSESILVFDAAEHFGVGRSVRLKFRRIIEFMNDDLSVTAKLLADPGRAAMLLSLMGGIALPAGELATIGNIAPQTASMAKDHARVRNAVKTCAERLRISEQEASECSRLWYEVARRAPMLTPPYRRRFSSAKRDRGRIRRVILLAGLSQMRWCFSHAAGFLSACGASSRLDERIPGIQRSS